MSLLHGIATIFLLAAVPLAQAATGPKLLAERAVPVADLARGHTLKLGAGAPGHRLIAVSQWEADVEIQVTDASGRQWKFDAPGRRAGPERAVVYDDGGGLTVVLSSPGRFSASGRAVQLTVAGLAPSDRIASGNAFEAESLESRAALESGTSPQRPIGDRIMDYSQAAGIWESRGDQARAGYAHLQSAWMLARRSSDHVAALERGQRARDAFKTARDVVGESLAILQMTVPRTELLNAGLDSRGLQSANNSAMAEALQSDVTVAVATFDAAGHSYFGAMARIQLAANYYLRDDLAAAIRLLGEAAEHYKMAGAPDGMARALANRCFMLYQTGRYRDAAEAFDNVIRSDATKDFPEVTADILDNSAMTQAAAGNYDKALSQFVRALSIHESVKDPTGMARSLNGLASTYLSLGNPRAAIEYSKRARDLLQQRDASGRLVAEPARLHSLLISGDAHRELGDFTAAEMAHREVLALANSDLAIARARLELARDLIDQGNGRRAIESLNTIVPKENSAWNSLSRQIRLRRSQALLVSGTPEPAVVELSQLRGQFAKLGAPELELEVLEALGRAQLKSGNVRDALVTSELGIAQLKALRLVSGNPEMRARLNDVYRSTYSLHVEALQVTRAREKDAASRRRIEARIFAAADEARAGLARATPIAGSLAAGEATNARKQLAAEIALRQKVLSGLEADEASSGRAASMRGELASLRARFDATSPALDSPLPVYQETDYSVGDLREDTAVLMFLNSAEKLHRYLIVRDSVRELEPLSVDVVSVRVQAVIRELDDAIPALRALSSVLMPTTGMIQGRNQIIVVGDNLTARVPFAALTLDAAGYSPLIRTHDVTMALTLRDALAIARLPDQARRIDLSRIAVFSDPVFTALDDRVTSKKRASGDVLLLTRLSGTAAEAKAILASLPASKVSAFSGFAANRDALLSQDVGSATVLHLATHAIANDRWPNGSGLILSALKPDGELINGYVSSLDLLARRSTTDLVVLSACDTARGETGASESVAGLARAMLGGGARRVVASHWAVDDIATARIMKEFYARLAAGDSATRALATAQRTVSAASQLRGPARWAAFVLYERGSSD